MKNHLNMSNAREPEQAAKMIELKKKGLCPFCPEYFKAYHDAPILREGTNWIITKNDYPYEGSVLHLLLIYKKHIDSAEKISTDGMIELSRHMKWIQKKFNLKGYGFTMRSGDNRYTGATITHLHAHIVAGTKEGKGKEKIKVPVGFKK